MSEILKLHLACPAALAIFPIQDLLALDGAYSAARPACEETINDPTEARHYWRFRLDAYLEDLTANGPWLTALRALVEASGRDAADGCPVEQPAVA